MHKTYLLLAIIIGAGFLLRIVSLSQVPPGLNRDEAAIGYTVYSLLKTGKDEYGKVWPLSFKSFGDWKVPVYFYLSLPFIQLLNLSEFTIRLPSAIFGTVTILLTYLLVEELLLNYKNLKGSKTFFSNLTSKQKNIISLLSAATLAILPWHVFMSRNASESNVAVFLVTLGLWTFFRSFRQQKLILVSFIFFSLSLFTYHGNHIFTPLLFIGLCGIFRKEIRVNPMFKIALVLFLIFSGIIFSQTLFSADKTKISGLFPLGDEAKLYEKIVLRRLEYKNNQFLGRLLHNKPIYLAETLINNYLRSFSPEFLFISGGTNAQHNIPGFGNLFVWQAPFILFAIGILAGSRSRVGYLLCYWLLISPIAASVTRDAPHTNRMMGFLPLPAIFTGFGLGLILVWLYNRKTIFPFVVTMMVVSGFYLIIYLDQYFVHFPYVSAKDWGYGFKEMVAKVTGREDKYKQIIIARPEVSPYIYFLFYNRFDPETFQKTVVRYPETVEGFQHVRQLGKLHFQKIDWTDELLIPDRLYVDWVEGVPSGATNSAVLITQSELTRLQKNNADSSGIHLGDWIVSRLVDSVQLPDGKKFIYFIETSIGTPSSQLL